MKTILVPTDFSDAADNAAEYAVHMAKEIHAKLLLLHVYHLPAPAGDFPVLIEPRQLQKENGARLQAEAKRLKKIANVEIKCVTRLGMAVDEILEEEKTADFIIMGMRGTGKIKDIILGGIATAMLRKAKVPLFLIPKNIRYHHPEKIVFACDFDPGTPMHSLNVLKELGKTVYVVNVKHGEGSKLIDARVEEQLEHKLDGIDHFYYFPQKEDLIDAINGFAESKQADMVAVIPHQYNVVEGLFHNSVSKKLAFHTRLPLLVLPDHYKRSEVYFI